MEIYIDNKKINTIKKNYSHFGVAIFEINKKLLKENRILNQIYINGEVLQDNSIVKMEELKTLEIITKTYGGVILESVQNAKQHMDHYFELMDNFYDFEDENFITFSEIELLEVTFFLNWFYNLLLLIKDNNILKFVNNDYEEYLTKFGESLLNIEQLYRENKYDELFTELDCTTNFLLMDFYDNIDNYIEVIIEEEKRRNLLN
ncbi:chemotaxis protein [Fusobacterium sp. PH5-44]|uniref:chemotaxis protein n=1 Tax=unclassified Fusobacterium TaxID=2648384 RepID=UPI003D2517BD